MFSRNQLLKLDLMLNLPFQHSIALSFYVTKTVFVGPKWFWSDQIDLDLTLMIWSRPKWNGQDQNELVRSKLWFSTKMNHIWTWPIHFGRDHFILVVTKSLWSSPNQFGQTKTILDWPKLFWSHRKTRHNSYLGGAFFKNASFSPVWSIHKS